MSKQWTPKNITFIPKKFKMAWEPEFSGEEDNLFVKIGPGLINNMLSTNFDEKFAVSKTAKTYFKLVTTFNISASSFEITSATIVVDGQEAETLDAEISSPPQKLEVTLGVYQKGEYFMFYNQSINAFVTEVLRTEKEAGPSSPGGDPFDRWYSWVIF